MRIVFFIFIAMTFFLNKVIAEEKLVYEFRVPLNPCKLLIHEKGLFMTTKNFGTVFLNNLQFDERGYYALCYLVFSCINCHKQFDIPIKKCDHCGSEELDFIGIGENKENDYLTVQNMLCLFLSDLSAWEKGMLLCQGNLKIIANADNDGNKEASISLKMMNEDKNLSVDGKASVNQDKDGKTRVKAEVEAGWDF